MKEDQMTAIRHRPPRLSRLWSGIRPFYFVTFNTYRRMPVLNSNAVHEAFLRYCVVSGTRGIAVGRYVIMPDHLHVFVVMPSNGVPLTQWVRSLKNVLGKTLLLLGCDKPHWQEGFFDHVLRSGESYSEKWDYVRRNPVRKQLVKTPEEWLFQGEVEVIRF